MSIKIIKAGVLDSIQDKGRFGQQHLGINPTGAMDNFALQVSNILVGNSPGEAVIEMHFPAAVFLFTAPALISLGGADFSASINGEPVPHLHPILVCKNDVLQFHKPINGARAYLAVAGGLALDLWMNSYSTHLKAKAGGFRGRSLQKDDELLLRQPPIQSSKQHEFNVLPWQADNNWFGKDHSTQIWVLPGHEWGRLTAASQESFTATAFVIAKQSDRMGYRLKQGNLQTISNEEVISSAVCSGTIQLLPDGGLIVLMADHQTTGGYPRVAHVITAHHSRLAQLKAGDSIQFRLADQSTAEELLIKQQQHLLLLQNACTFRLEEYFHANRY